MTPTLHRIKRRHARRDERGFVAVGAMACAGFVFIILASITLLVARSVHEANDAVGMQEARVIAESGAEEIYSRTLPNPDYFVASTPANYQSHPAATANTWWRFDEGGQLVPCGSNKYIPCFSAEIQPPSNNPTSMSVKVRGTSRCQKATRSICSGSVTYQQTLRRRSFLEFILHADSETLDTATLPANLLNGYPSGCDTRAADRTGDLRAACIDAAYQGTANTAETDTIVGPIHSNDSRILICRNPEFTDIVEIAEATGSGWEPASDPGCVSNSPSGGTFVSGPKLALPFKRLDDPSTSTDESAGYDPFALARAIAETDSDNAASPDIITGNGPFNVSLNGASININGSSRRLPDSGVLYFDTPADVRVSGILNGQLSLVSEGNIHIVDDVVYSCAPTPPPPSTGSSNTNGIGIPASCDDALGLNALESIIVDYSPRDRTIDAALAAVNHSVYVNEWLTADKDLVCGRPEYVNVGLCRLATDSPTDLDTIPELRRAPTLTIRGAIVGHYRGVFGAYDRGSSDIPTGTEGRLISGYAKRFVYDARLRNTVQPPYFVEPVSSAWAKIDEAEVTDR